jgi:uncharacterized protein (DUF1800 family)
VIVKPLLTPVRPLVRRRSSVDLPGFLGSGPSTSRGQAGQGAALVSDPSPAQLAQAAHVARRATFGATPELVASIAALTPARWLQVQLAPDSFADREADAVLARIPGLTWSIAETRGRVEDGETSPAVLTDAVGQAAVIRMAWSRRQLLEVMTDLWSDHFNVPADGATWDSRMDYDRTVRDNSLGRFSDLLVACTTHPAMLRYLGTDVSRPGKPNEHHGRELLELHTVGPEARVTEAEVRDSARILTGLTIDPSSGEAVYRSDLHNLGQVAVQGLRHPNQNPDGYPLVVGYLNWLAHRPETARRVARLLAVRFVADNPPSGLVDRLARLYLDHDTSIAAVLTALFAAPEFSHPSAVRVRRPVEDVIGAVRALGVRPDATGTRGISGLYWMLDTLGQAPLACPAPTGYPARGTDWLSASGLIGRWNIHLSLAGGWRPSGLVFPGWRALLPADLPTTYGDVVDALADRVLLRRLADADRTAVCAAVGRAPSAAVTGAALDAEGPQLVALLLDSPAHCQC